MGDSSGLLLNNFLLDQHSPGLLLNNSLDQYSSGLLLNSFLLDQHSSGLLLNNSLDQYSSGPLLNNFLLDQHSSGLLLNNFWISTPLGFSYIFNGGPSWASSMVSLLGLLDFFSLVWFPLFAFLLLGFLPLPTPRFGAVDFGPPEAVLVFSR